MVFKTNNMKLYTEEQVSKIIFETKQWSNLSEDWLMASVTPIELPSDEEIEKVSLDFGDPDYFNMGAEWLKELILNQNK